jgi:arabinofuranosyltransferase
MTDTIKSNSDSEKEAAAPVVSYRIYSICGIAILLVLASCLVYPGYWGLGEDSYITYRYALNFAAGHGLVFNPGEYVEGYSNPLWLFMLIPWLSAGVPIAFASRIMTFIMSAALIILIWRMGHYGRGRKMFLPAFAALLFVFNYYFVHYAQLGLETILLALLLTLAAFLLMKKQLIPTSILLGLAAWTRPEGAIYFVALTILLESRRYFQKEKLDRGAWYIPAFILLAVLFLWRWNYYHEFFPNTYYAKVDPGAVSQKVKGLRRVLAFLFSGTRLLFWLPAVMLIFKRPKDNRVLVYLTVILADFFYVIMVGGDFLPLFRYVVPVLPLIVLLTGEGLIGIDKFLSKYSWRVPAVAGVCLVVLLGGFGHLGWQGGGPMMFGPVNYLKSADFRMKTGMKWTDPRPIDDIKAYVGVWIDNNLPAEARIATGQIGQLAFYSNRETLDLIGLANKFVAKNGGFTIPFLVDDWAPDYIFLECNPDFPKTLYSGFLLQNRKFRSNYELYRGFSTKDEYKKEFWIRFICYKRRDIPVEPPEGPAPLTKQFEEAFSDSGKLIAFDNIIDLAAESELARRMKPEPDWPEVARLCGKILDHDPENVYARNTLKLRDAALKQ